MPSKMTINYALMCVIVASGLLLAFRGGVPLGSALLPPGYVASENITVLQPNEFSWDTLPARRSLKWHDCIPDRQCARLIVPLNYSDPDGREATIALIRRPAAVPSSSPLYRGPVLFNPGGPGGSGVDQVGGPRGELFSQILGPHFDIVSFDPRGIGRSTPRASFFQSDAERALWGENEGLLSISNNSDHGIGRAWARAQVLGRLAGETDDGYLRHINTDQTARDMLRIVEAHGRSKIQYWGFSYGSVLGATFAAMFPDKIERLIIDGVVDSENYYAALWSNNLLDTDKVLDAFFTGCAEAGAEGCPFWAPTPDAISRNLTSLYDAIRARPVPVKTDNAYGVVDYGMLRNAVFRSLYAPYTNFPWLAQALSELAEGDGRMIFERAHSDPFECSCDKSVRLDPVHDAQPAIACNDGDDVPSDFESAQEYFEMMTKESNWADIWSTIHLSCVGWPKFPKDHFQGPFVGNTSHPIFLIGNTAGKSCDTIMGGKKKSRGFTGSVVLTQDSPGHCSLSAPSICTQKYVREYFVNGTLPELDTICQPDSKPFPNPEMKAKAVSQMPLSTNLNEEEEQLYKAVQELSKSYIPTFPL